MSYRRYRLERLIQTILSENPAMSFEQAEAKAILIRRELHRLQVSWRRSQLRHQAHVLWIGLSLDRPYWSEDEDDSEIC